MYQISQKHQNFVHDVKYAMRLHSLISVQLIVFVSSRVFLAVCIVVSLLLISCVKSTFMFVINELSKSVKDAASQRLEYMCSAKFKA